MSQQMNRRTLLRGIGGTTMALPLLEAMTPAALGKSIPYAAPNRVALIFFPNGAIMDKWKSKGSGQDFELNTSLASLESHKKDLLLFTGLTQHHARANGDGAGDHARNASAFLTGAQPRKTSGADIEVGISIDQAIAKQIGHQTRLPSLELGIERGRNAGSCDSGYSCAYSTNISWKSPNTPNGKEIKPKLAFERIFGTREDAQVTARRNRMRKSILDFVSEDAQRLNGRLGGADRKKLDEYFTSVREIEQRIERASQLQPTEIPDMELPQGVPDDLTEHLRLMYDILILAFQTDSTRVATFMVGDAGCNRAYRDIGVKSGHHELSHHRNNDKKMEQIARIDKYLVEQFSSFLSRMKDVQEGEGHLLNNSMVLYGSAISDGNRHSHHDLPIILAGQGAGALETGRLIENKNETPLNNLFLTLADRMGASVREHGDSTGALKI